MRTGRYVVCFVCALGVAAFAAPAAANSEEPGLFWIGMAGDDTNWNVIDPGVSGGNGYTSASNGPWFYYENLPVAGGAQPTQPPMVPGWWNQWWYDHPYDPERWKEVELDFDYMRFTPGQDGLLDIWVNWSLPAWSLLDPNDPTGPGIDPSTQPPLPGDDIPPGTYIGRTSLTPGGIAVDNDQLLHFHDEFDLRQYGIDYNPEWISVDVVGYGFLISDPSNPGSIYHRCMVPEPITLGLLSLSVAGIAGYVRRRRA